MITELSPNLYRIKVPLPGNPLRDLNSYFIRGDAEDLLIDTGFNREECRQALAEGLKDLGADISRLNVFCTHSHSDHCGLAADFAGSGKRIWMSCLDLERMTDWMRGGRTENANRRYLAEGFPKDLLEELTRSDPPGRYHMKSLDERLTGLAPGSCLRFGDYELKLIAAPGHTPGNSMLWCENQGIMFTGDHILFDITPNITCWKGVTDSLGDYLDSLRAALDYPVRLALPGHREIGSYRERIAALQAHHERRLTEVVRILTEEPGLTAYEIAGRMRWHIRCSSWEDFPAHQKWFAMGECLSHLDHLILENRIIKEDGAEGLRYRPQ